MIAIFHLKGEKCIVIVSKLNAEKIWILRPHKLLSHSTAFRAILKPTFYLSRFPSLNYLNIECDCDLKYTQLFIRSSQKVVRTINLSSGNTIRGGRFAMWFPKMVNTNEVQPENDEMEPWARAYINRHSKRKKASIGYKTIYVPLGQQSFLSNNSGKQRTSSAII